MHETAPQAAEQLGTVFLFPGQGAYDAGLLHELWQTGDAELAAWFAQADAAARRLLGEPFLPLAAAATAEQRQAAAAASPDLQQLGIFLGGVATARLLERHGARPGLLLGHSFGELAALAAAAVFDIATGCEIVCQRVLALRAVATTGGMAALSCGPDRAADLLAELAGAAGDGGGRTEPAAVTLAVLNHDRQTVVAGPRRDLAALAELAARQGVGVTVIKSAYPFHSPHLAPAVDRFAASLRGCVFAAPRLPVYLAMERRLWAPGLDLPALLAAQLTRRLDFAAAVRGLHAQGYRRFVEMGRAELVGKLVAKVLGDAAVTVEPAASPGDSLMASLARTARRTGGAEAAGAGEGGRLAELAALLRDALAPIERASRLLQEIAAARVAAPDNGGAGGARALPGPLAERPSAPEPVPVQEPDPEPAPEPGAQPPIAIVGMGCILPGASDPDEFWRQVLGGVSGIVDLAALDPDLGRDFLAAAAGGEVQVVPDKTYALLSGAILEVPYDPARLGPFWDAAAFDALTRGQKMLARALGQSLDDLPASALAGGAGRVQCILGATADGSSEYDEARFLESAGEALAAADELPAGDRRALAARLERLPGLRSGCSEALRQHALYQTVAGRLLGEDVPVYVVDAACSSSLYALDLGIAALAGGEADAVVAGGVFAAGPANNALFAQFRGLSPHASRPLDAAADGVVFGDGAAVVVLQRLPDALAAGAAVLGVIRAVGLSSDGRSASVNVPQAAGQSLAIRRAYAANGLSLDSVQLVEAHATATPVGDAVELRSLAEVFAGRAGGLPRIQLGSVKALIGHTGWVSGVASLIKVIKALGARTIPPQYNFTAPHPDLDLAASPFAVTREALPWPPNAAPCPRRAGINGFGFGGTNAHLVVEEFDDAYHRRLCAARAHPAAAAAPEIVVVGATGLFAAGATLAPAPGEAPPAAATLGRFRRADLRLPAGKRLLPDVTDHMDASQYLAALAAERLFAGLPPRLLAEAAAEIAVVVGLEGKTERGVRANERIFLDRLRRLAAASAPSAAVRAAEAAPLAELAGRLARRGLPSGPYTLPGLMPNVAASRVASLFDLKGPNLVIDRGEGSLVQALAVAAGLLTHHRYCRLALAGGLNAAARPGDGDAEGIVLLALASAATARELGLPVLATLTVAPAGAGAATAPAAPAAASRNGTGRPRWRGVHGGLEVLAALDRVREPGAAASVGGGTAGRRLVFAAAAPATPALPATPVAPALPALLALPVTTATENAPDTPLRPASHAYVQGTPIETCTPVLVAAPPAAPPASFAGRRLLVLTDQAELWESVARSPLLAAAERAVAVCPADCPVAGAVALDLSSAAGLAAAAAALARLDFDTVLALTRLTPAGDRSLLLAPLAGETRLLDLLFVACQHAYEALGRGAAAVYTLCLGAFTGGRPHAATGLFGGFAKALSRELPAAAVRSVLTDALDPAQALRQLAVEMGQPRQPVETCWRGERRETFALAAVAALAADAAPLLDAGSVVLATAGGRGVTAVLAEELLCRFGCTVIALGRSDPGSLPALLAGASEAEMAAYEATFYRDELRRDPAQKIPELKRRLAAYQAAHEAGANVRRLERLGGRFEYHSVDLQDEAAVARRVADVYARYGKLDLVVHGAGIQASKVLPKKPLAEFRRVVGTKLGGLAAIYRACQRHAPRAPVHFHLLSSAFSVLGNDGQPDYGAANEAMNRLAAVMDGKPAGAAWSSLAWLGWAGVGMTRGTEFAALAASRRLRGITRAEGREIFGRLMAGRPTTPINVLLAAGERDFYRPALAPPFDPPPPPTPPPAHQAPPAADALVVPLAVDLEQAPFLRDHLVQGVPTLPGAFLLCIAADAARRLRPRLRVVAFENTSFRRFVRVYEGRPTELRLDTRVVEEERDAALVRVQVLADFVHKGGMVLQRDVVQTEIFLRLAANPAAPPPCLVPCDLAGGRELPDPYLAEGSPVRLNGRFKSLRRLAVAGDRRLAHYQLAAAAAGAPGPADPAGLQHLLPNLILVDAFWRFGTVMATAEQALGVYVPERCDRMRVYFDYTDFELGWLHEPTLFSGANPRPRGDQLFVGPIEARDREGRLRLTVEGGVCRKFGEVRHVG